MARLSTYAIDGTPVSSDKLIGTDSAGTVTKNYPLGDVADWLKSSGATAVLGQNNYLFQIALDPDEGRKIGSFSFENYGGDGTAFEDVTNLKFSASSSAGKYIADYLLSTVDQKIMLSQLDDPNSFGIYVLASLVQSPLEPTFYDATLAVVSSNGVLRGNKSYGLATYSALNEAGGGTWGSITGTITNQTDLVDYIDAEIAAIPAPATPTLQSVTDAGAITTNDITTGSVTSNGNFLITGNDSTVQLRGSSVDFNIQTAAANNVARIATTTGGSARLELYNHILGFNGALEFKATSWENDALVISGGTPNTTKFLVSRDPNAATLQVTGESYFTGNVGIGTTAPTEKLHVSGNIRLGLLGSQGYYLSWGQNEVSSSGDFARIYGIRTDGAGNQAGHLVFQTKAPLSGNTPSERLRITDVGNVGIGTTAPTSTLHVSGTARIHSAANGAFGTLTLGSINDIVGDVSNINFKNNGSSWMRILNGNVGIGTTAPSEKLDVVGNVKADGAIAPVMRNEGDIKKVINPKGGQYSMGTGSATGALVIKFPDGIDLTDNYANYQFAIQIGAQTISPAEFFIQARWLVGGFNDLNGYATSAENFDYKISVGKDGTNKYLIIGETTTSWVRNSFIIKEVYVDYINPADIDVYRDGWEISIMSDISAITVDVSQAHSDYAYQAVAAVKKENAALTASSWNTIATLGSLSGAGVFVLKRLDQAILSFTVSESYGRRHLNVNYYTALNTTTIEGVRITTNGKVQVLLGTTYNSNWEINCYYAKNVTLTAEVADPADAAAQSIDITGNNVGEIHTDAFVINQALTVKTSTGTDTLYAANTGDVGIGTTAPDSKLHVKATSGIAFKVDPNSADKEWYIDTTNPDHLKKEGNLILNADPTNVHTSTKISFNIDGSNKASINSDGDLGVGTTAQTSKLHVDGTAMRQLRIGTAGGPSSNTDTSGAEGDIAYDDLYLYIKTGSGWGRVALDFAF